MDSGNSGSVQSSSGGGDDQEYDSRPNSISAYFNPTPPQPQPHPISNSPQLFDPSSLLNFVPIWSKPLRSDPNCIETNPISTSPPPTQVFFRPSYSPPVRFPPLFDNNHSITTTTTTTTPPANSTDHALGARSNPRKRSRASRRAPTTVLTTDTSNFRAMVQEFTGIPPPPFSPSSSPFNRSTPLDLFSTPSSIRSNSFLLRPFAQKFQPPPLPPFFSPPTSATVSNSPLINFPTQTPIQIFDPRKSTLPNLSNGSLELLLIPPNDTSHLTMGVLDEFELGHGLPNRPNHFSLQGNERVPVGWASAGVGPNNTDQSHLMSGNGNYDYSHESVKVDGNSVNFPVSSSGFLFEKGSEDAGNRGEDTVEPWICSSSDH